jgi:thiosulfate dehydrogenase [quinone] large subunit
VKPSSRGAARGQVVISDPPIAEYVFSNTHLAGVWLLARLWLGWVWLESGLGKIGHPGWVAGGEAVKGYWERALGPGAAGRPVIAVDWYRGFIQALYDAQAWTWLAPVIVWGEVICGVLLLLGLLTGLAAFGGSFLNWSFLMAGTASINGLMFAVSVLVMLAWKTAGWYGLDRWALPWIGRLWTRGAVQVGLCACPACQRARGSLARSSTGLV